jgi:uncharacterized membrane protein YciS (DUF1049 family)
MEFSLVMIVTLAILLALGYISCMIYLVFFYSKGKAGEKAVARRLKRLAEEEYKVINDLMLLFRGRHTLPTERGLVIGNWGAALLLFRG